MEALQIIVSVLMFVVLLVAIQKKFHPVTVLLAVGVVALFFWGGITQVTGAETSSGNYWLDAFEVFSESALTYISSTGLTVMTVLGYVAFMDHLHATDMFAYYISTPLKKVKNPYIVGMLVIVIGFIFVCALPSGVSNVVLLFGIIYPIMRSVGLSKRSAISAITIGCAICGYIGPANAVSGLVITQLGDATTMGDLFVTALPYIAIYMVVALIVYFFTARFFDKREAANLKDADPEELKEFDMSQVTRPKWYSIFPLLPLIFVLIFSSLIPGTATIVGVAGTLFSTALTLVGGINLLAVKFTSLPNMSIGVVLVVFTILHAVMFFITGSGPTCIFTLMPILYSILTAAGREDLLVPACVCILLVSQSIGQACTPVSAATLFISGATNEAPTTVAKRNALPAICGGVVTLIAIMIFLV